MLACNLQLQIASCTKSVQQSNYQPFHAYRAAICVREMNVCTRILPTAYLATHINCFHGFKRGGSLSHGHNSNAHATNMYKHPTIVQKMQNYLFQPLRLERMLASEAHLCCVSCQNWYIFTSEYQLYCLCWGRGRSQIPRFEAGQNWKENAALLSLLRHRRLTVAVTTKLCTQAACKLRLRLWCSHT